MQHSGDERPAGVDAGTDREVGRQQRGRHRGHDQLGVARRGEQPVLVSAVEQLALVIHHRDAPEALVERRRVEPLVEPLGERWLLCGEGQGTERGAPAHEQSRF